MRASCVRSRKRLFVLCSGYHRFAPTLLRGGVSLFIAHSTLSSVATAVVAAGKNLRHIASR